MQKEGYMWLSVPNMVCGILVLMFNSTLNAMIDAVTQWGGPHSRFSNEMK